MRRNVKGILPTYLPAVSKLAEMLVFIDSAKFKMARSSRIQNVIVVLSPILKLSNSSGLQIFKIFYDFRQIRHTLNASYFNVICERTKR